MAILSSRAARILSTGERFQPWSRKCRLPVIEPIYRTVAPVRDSSEFWRDPLALILSDHAPPQFLPNATSRHQSFNRMNSKHKDHTLSRMNAQRNQALPTLVAAEPAKRDAADPAFVRLEELAIVFSAVHTALGDSSALWQVSSPHSPPTSCLR